MDNRLRVLLNINSSDNPTVAMPYFSLFYSHQVLLAIRFLLAARGHLSRQPLLSVQSFLDFPFSLALYSAFPAIPRLRQFQLVLPFLVDLLFQCLLPQNRQPDLGIRAHPCWGNCLHLIVENVLLLARIPCWSTRSMWPLNAHSSFRRRVHIFYRGSYLLLLAFLELRTVRYGLVLPGSLCKFSQNYFNFLFLFASTSIQVGQRDRQNKASRVAPVPFQCRTHQFRAILHLQVVPAGHIPRIRPEVRQDPAGN